MISVEGGLRTPDEGNVEMVERKGIGHPDSLADGIAEEVSRELSRKYIEMFGSILHHNTDKLEIVGGEAKAWFGGGEVIRPVLVFLSGRASKPDGMDIHEIAISAARKYLSSALRHYKDEWFRFQSEIGEGSADLVGNFSRLRANDTSFGTGFWPYTKTEKLAMDIESYLNSDRAKKKYPAIGEDIKVMAVRIGEKTDITIAMAAVSTELASKQEYDQLKEDVASEIREMFGVEPKINNADGEEAYITMLGSSIESGDDGAVGRGNRVSGLITPMREMSLEAAAGKNPVTHVGKLYNVAAMRIARRIYNEFGEPCSVRIVSRIGDPITDPTALSIIAKRPDTRMERIAEEEMQSLPELWKGILKGSERLF